MRITCDKEVDVLRIIFRETTVTSRELGDGIAIDLDEDGRLAGIEVLDAVSRFGDKDTLKKWCSRKSERRYDCKNQGAPAQCRLLGYV